MSCGTAVLAGLRSLVVVVSLAVVGLGAWTLHTVHDVEIRGSVVLDTIRLEPQEKEEAWRDFFDEVIDSQLKIWIAIAAGSFSFLVGVLVLLSMKLERVKISNYLLVPLELLSMLSMGAALGATISLAVRLAPIYGSLDISSSGDLMAWGMLGPMSKGYAIASGVGCSLLVTTFISGLVSLCMQHRKSKTCSFEPTASSLGMSHGYQAVQPPAARSTIPTLYDPQKPVPGTAVGVTPDEEMGLKERGADMGRRDSGMSQRSQRSLESEGAISGPLGLQNPAEVHQVRPARPWSEAPKRRV